jgi:gamma-glutamyltranspeptidase
VVEPDASGLGGDGQAILFLKGMTEPVVVEYKDMTPGHATPDNPKIFTATGGRTAPDGPTVANIPGIPAGPRSALQEVRQQEDRVGGPDRAGNQAGR